MDRDSARSTAGDGAQTHRTPEPAADSASVKPAARRRGPVSAADLLGPQTPAPTKSAPVLDDGQIPEAWRPFHRLLLDVRDRLTNRVQSHSKETLTQNTRESAGDLSSYSLHMADAGTDNWDRDFNIGLLSSERDLLFEIDQALERIEQGTYGVCELSGQAIPAERLRAVPWARYSVAAQARIEDRQRRMARLSAQRDAAAPAPDGSDPAPD